MSRSSRRSQSVQLLLLLAAGLTHAQLTNLPTLATGSQSASPTTKGSPTGKTGKTKVSHLTGLPTLEGVGIPIQVVPYTANAPYMRKSSLPEGTFFIAVGAALAFFGACVLLWRLMVAWSVNLSVKRSTKASLAAQSEKGGSLYSGWGGAGKPSNYQHSVNKSNFFSSTDANSVSMENLTGSGKPTRFHQYRDAATERSGAAPPQDLFFSPTAHSRDSSMTHQPRVSSGHMPSGFYASPSAQPAGGAGHTTIGGSGTPTHSPYKQTQHHRRTTTETSHISRPSPSASPERGTPTRGSTAMREVSRDVTLHSRETSRNMVPAPIGYNNGGKSSLTVGQSAPGGGESGTSSRAPSAYLEDLFDQKYTPPRERWR